MKSKVLKYSVLSILLIVSVSGIYYLKLPNRHKAIVKNQIFQKLGIVDNTWNIQTKNDTISLLTPTMVIDQVYKSMEGPKMMRSFQLDNTKNDLVWITSFNTQAVSTNEVDQLSNDYVCHTNIDFYDDEHYSFWQLNDRIGKQYPRLTTLSNGIESYQFPEGFGFPVFTNENLFLVTQTLNHNIKSESFSVKHKVTLGFKKNSDDLKPLKGKTVFIMLPYNENKPYDNSNIKNPNLCIPIETKNHNYIGDKGQHLSGHWVIYPGEATYSFNITKQLQLKDSITMHFIASHLHPFAEALKFRDITIDSILFTSKAENYPDKIGLKKVSYFSSEEGIMLYPDHQYELILTTNNTTKVNQDMMASMFVFFYDKEMADKLKLYNLK